MNYHVVIQTEHRVATPEKPRELAIAIKGQLHAMGKSVADMTSPQILYAAEWDQVSPWVTVLKGSIADLKMAYAGWPMVTKEEWITSNPKTTPK